MRLSQFQKLFPKRVVLATLLVSSLFFSVAASAASRSAGPGEVCEEDKDTPPTPRRVLVLDLVTLEDAEPELAKAFAEDIRSVIPDRDDLVLLSLEAAVATGVDGLATCRKSSCLSEIAAATESSFILYGTLRRQNLDDGIAWVATVQVFDAEAARPLAKINAESTEPAVIGASLRKQGPGLVPTPPVLKVVDCGPPALVERPLFILGSGITLAGAVAFLGASAWLLDLEQKLGSPAAHRELKWEAIIWGRTAIVATAASTLIVGAGVALLAAGVVLEEEE